MSPAARRTATRRTARKQAARARRQRARARAAARAAARQLHVVPPRVVRRPRVVHDRRASGGNATVRGLTTSLDSVDKRLKTARSKVDTSSKRLLREIEGHIKNARKTVQELGKQLQDGASPLERDRPQVHRPEEPPPGRAPPGRPPPGRAPPARAPPAQDHRPEEHRRPAHQPPARAAAGAAASHGAALNGTLGGARPVCLEQPDGVSLAEHGAQAVEIGSHWISCGPGKRRGRLLSGLLTRRLVVPRI